MANNLTVTYKGNTIHTASVSGSATLETGGTWCEGDIGLSYTFDGSQFYLNVTVDSGAFVTASKGGTTVSGTSVGGSCVLTLPEAGTWTVTATKSGMTSDTVSVIVVDTYSAELSFDIISSTLNDNSWNIIRKVSDAGTGANYWNVGDRKEITLNGTVGGRTFTNYSTVAFILGFNHNSSVEGNKRIHFEVGKTALTGGVNVVYTDSTYGNAGSGAGFRMNTSITNTGGWGSSYMRLTNCGNDLSSPSGTFIAVLPSDLQAVLKTVKKLSSSSDVIFIPSEKELTGTTTSSNAGNDVQYAYYASGNSKMKYRYNSTSNAAHYWTRSASASSNQTFIHITTGGSASTSNANLSRGFAPCFCV